MNRRPLTHVYLHTPFCQKLCPYCAFYKTLNTSKIPAWLEQIQKDVSELANRLDGPLDTLYFGGGSPGLLSTNQIFKLTEPLRPFFAADLEWSIELNPWDVSEKKLAELKKLGISRISLGVQTFDENWLARLGRPNRKRIHEAITQIKAAGFDNLSIDLIYGWPDQSWDDFEQDLLEFLKLDLPHLSVYRLQIEENSVFGKKGMREMDEDLDAAFYEKMCTLLRKSGYHHYEISSFAKAGYESRHNLGYWSDHFYAGLGPGASGYEKEGYYTNEPLLYSYLKGERNREVESADPFNAIMMSLRTSRGLNVDEWNERYSLDFASLFEDVLKKHEKMLCWQDYSDSPDRFIRVSEEGWLILDTILVDFMLAME